LKKGRVGSVTNAGGLAPSQPGGTATADAESAATVDRRRRDTRERIQRLALALFSEQGYDNTSLLEIADRVQVTRPALYYHFRTKAEILTSIVADLGAQIATELAWVRSQPPGIETRRELLRRLSSNDDVRWRSYLCFAFASKSAPVDLPVHKELTGQLGTLWRALTPPGADLRAQLQVRLALKMIFAAGPILQDLPGTPEQQAAAALDIAIDLLP
jgi:AcrR family transcriptional regulator